MMLRSKSIVTGGEGGGSVVARELPRRDGDTWYQTFPAELKNLLGVDLRILDNEVIGEGSESTVYRAFLEGSEQVAVKRPRIRGFECLQRFKRECAILADLAPHPGIACLKGADPSPQRRALVLPLALGDLGTLLHDKGVRLGTNLALSYALQSAEALQHVHERGFIHRDVKSANLLVVPGWRNVVLSDFGLAQVQSTLAEKEARAASIAGNRGPTGGIYRIRMVGTLVCLAPEVLGNLPHTSASDVYSWAVMANELLSATVPYSDRLMANSKHHTILDQTFNQADLMQAIYLGLRPVVDHSQTPDWVQDLVARTWVGEPLDRPSAHDVASALRARGIDSNIPSGAEPRDLGELVGAKEACLVPEVSWRSVRKGEQVVSSWEPPLRCDIGSFLTAGRRGWDKMEDCIFLERLEDSGIILFGVMDGHAGKEVSSYIQNNLKRAFFTAAGEMGEQDVPGSVLSKALQILETEIMCLEGVASGSTALIGCITGECVWMANVGDCRAVCEAQGGSVQRLTRDHTARDPDEAMRVASFGGRVEGGRVNGMIEVSRTLGDKALKPPLSSEPEIFCHSVRGLRYFVAASDGLWEVMTDEDAMGLVRDTVKVPELAAKRLGMEAIDPRGSKDNISCVVVIFGELSGSVEKVY